VIATASAIQIDRHRVAVETNPAALAQLRRQFAERRYLHLPGFFSRELMATLLPRLRVAAFKERVARCVTPPAVDWKLTDAPLLGLLHFLLNEAALIQFARRVSGHPDATGFVGSVYRLVPGFQHRDSWHDDLDGNRLVALTINLSEGAFDGGELEMRQHGSAPLWCFANTGPGDALLFALGRGLQHRIRPIAGTSPKTAFAGWFCRDADLRL
jgi:hypothetical protein